MRKKQTGMQTGTKKDSSFVAPWWLVKLVDTEAEGNLTMKTVLRNEEKIPTLVNQKAIAAGTYLTFKMVRPTRPAAAAAKSPGQSPAKRARKN